MVQLLVSKLAFETGMKLEQEKEEESEMGKESSSDEQSELDLGYSTVSSSELTKVARTGRGSVINSEDSMAQGLGLATEPDSGAYSEEEKAAASEMMMVALSVEMLEVGWEWVKALSSGERLVMGSEEVLVSPLELESVASLGSELEPKKEGAMGAEKAQAKEPEWEEASGKETARVLEQAWALARASTSGPSMEVMSESIKSQ